jgi:hypothetical protein
MTRLSNKINGIRALRLVLYRHPEGVKTENILRELDLQVDRVRDRTNVWRWLREIEAHHDGNGIWSLRPSAEEVEYARAVLACVSITD